MHIVGLDADDPYLAERTEEIRERFDGRVPMLVNCVNAVGRAREWLDDADGRVRARRPQSPNPCTLAAWPLVAFDGTVVACGNDDVVDGPAPAHLRLGHADVDGWPEIKRRTLASSMLRAIRTFGPEYIVDRQGSGVDHLRRLLRDLPADGLRRPDARVERVDALMAGPTGALDRGAGRHAAAPRRRAGLHPPLRDGRSTPTSSARRARGRGS